MTTNIRRRAYSIASLALILFQGVINVGCSKPPGKAMSSEIQDIAHERMTPTAEPQPKSNEVVVKLSQTSAIRTGRPHVSWAGNVPIYEEPEAEKLVRGDLKVGSQTVSFFVPFGPYILRHSSHASIAKSSTIITVDQNGNGAADKGEDWYAGAPIRLGDAMFEVQSIDPASTWILLRKSTVPLAGAIVGKKCPDFSFTTTDGKQVQLSSYKGKYLLLDVWSMT